MQTNSSKKRTAVVATAVAAALMLTGTFAWTLATDDTVLNEFEKTAEGSWNAEIEEDFDPADPWADKNVRVVNTADNPIIVRVRFEEFFDLTYRNGTNYSATANGESIFQVPSTSTLTGLDADSSTTLDNAVTLTFADGVVTMADYNGMNEAAKAGVKWVIDTDGWCYYTTAISAEEKSTDLLDLVTFNKDVFDTMYDAPYDLNYYINVRLQAMSSDLSSFGSTTDATQWTNEGSADGAGRVITATGDLHEITTDTTITPEAKALVMSIPNPAASQGKYAANTEDLFTVLADDTTEKVVLSDDIALTGTQELNVFTDKTIDLNGNTITVSDTEASYPYVFAENATLTIENGTISAENTCVEAYNGTVILNDVTLQSTNGYGVFADVNSTVVLNDCTVDVPGVGVAINGNNVDVTVNGGSIKGAVGVGAVDEFTGANVNITGASVEGSYSAVLAMTGMTLNVSDSTLTGETGIGTNNTDGATSIAVSNTTISATQIGVFKSDESSLEMTGCTVNVTNGDGIVLRGGNGATLTDVNVTVNGTGTAKTVAELDAYYGAKSGYEECGYNALAVILNGYTNIDLTINGGSYTTAVDGAQSVYVCNDGMNCATTPETFSNSITVSGKPTFSPAFTFGTYDNTTVTVK